MFAPIIIFAFNRPRHLQRTLLALGVNEGANESDLTIFCDGPRNAEERLLTEATRLVAREAQGFRSVNVVERISNWGLEANIIDGVTRFLESHDTVIVLEDDLVTSPYFLRYMNDGLAVYADNDRVASIHGWCFPHTDKDLPEIFFLRGADCLGWATWRRAWAVFEPDAGVLLKKIRHRKLEYLFNVSGTYDYVGMLEGAATGKVGSWAVRWLASTFLADMYTLNSSSSFVTHIGGDGSGSNTGQNDIFDVPLAEKPVEVRVQKVEVDAKIYEAYHNFLSRLSGLSRRSKCSWWYHVYAKPKIKYFMKCVLPPVLITCLQRVLETLASGTAPKADTNIWQTGFTDWQSAQAVAGGYDTEPIFEKVLASSRQVRDGLAVYERDSVLMNRIEYSWPLLAGLMWAAAHHDGELNIIDFGGSLGSTYRQNRRFLKGLGKVRWSVVEQPHFVRAGREEFQTEELRFYESIEECLAEEHADGIVFSSVLQYLEDPYAVMERVCAHGLDYVILDRTPFSKGEEVITVQHVPENIYSASYACRFLERKQLEAIIWQDYDIVEWFEALGGAGWKGLIALRRLTD